MSKAKEESSGDNSEIVDLQSKQQTDFNANQAKKSETNASPTNRDEDLQMYIDSNGLVKRKASKSMIPTAVHNGPGQSTGTNDRTTEMDTGLVPPTPPSHHHHHHQHQLVRIQPAIPSNANIRNILENVTKTEGPFKEPDEAIKAAIAAFTQDAW